MMPGNPAFGSTVLRLAAEQSPNFKTGVSGWIIRQDGTVEFNSGTFRGTVTAGEFDGTDFIINSSGAFFYSGTPAAGNLIASVVPGSTPIQSDPFGNTVFPGVYSYAGSGFAGIAGAGLTLQNGSFPWEILVDSSSGLLVMQFPHTGSQIYMQDTGSAGSLVPNQPANLVPEIWHNVTPPTGFSGLLRYRARTENDVEVQAQLAVANTVAAGPVTLITLPTAYTPASTQRGPCGVFLNGAPASLAAVQGIMDLRWSANPAGTFTLQGFPGGASGTGVTECSFNIRYALD